MSDHKDPKQTESEKQGDFSVDEILAEFGTGRYRKKPDNVVEFPQEPKVSRIEEDELPHPEPRREETPPVDEIVPESVTRGIGARISTLRRKADHYADHMYDQAEPDEETLKADKYIPGVDREEVSRAEPHRARRFRQPAQVPPDTAPADLA